MMHQTFEIIRPDEVAECWEGVSPELYQSLWACVPLYTGPSPEESEEPVYGLNAVGEFWDLFEPEEQEALNALAEAQEAAWDYDDGQPDEAQEWESYDPDC